MRPEAYQTFSRTEWAKLRANTPLTLTERSSVSFVRLLPLIGG